MMEEEKYIEKLAGRRNPFIVPDGYFDHLADRLMAALPEQKPKARPIWMRPVFYAAASICLLLISAGVWLALPNSYQQAGIPITAQQDPTDESFDEAVDYMMLDNHDIYAYLADD